MELSREQVVLDRVGAVLRDMGGTLTRLELADTFSQRDPEGAIWTQNVHGSLMNLVRNFPDRFTVSADGVRVSVREEKSSFSSTGVDEWGLRIRKLLNAKGGECRLSLLIPDKKMLEEIRGTFGGLKKLLLMFDDIEVLGENGLDTVRFRSRQSVGGAQSSTVKASTPVSLLGWAVNRLEELGGSFKMDSFLAGFTPKAAEISQQYGGFKKFILHHHDVFEIQQINGDRMLTLRSHGQKKSTAAASATAAKKPFVKPELIGARATGEIVKIDGKRCFVLEESQHPNCPSNELYFISTSRFKEEDLSRIAVGARLSFKISGLTPNPNPVGDDPIILGGGSSFSETVPKRAPNGDYSGIRVIETLHEGKVACLSLMNEKIVAVDCEGVDLGRPNGKLCLVQIANRTNAFLFDVQTCPELLDHALKEFLESQNILKAFHDCRNDVTALFERDIALNGVFDTQIGLTLLDPRSKQPGLQQLLRCTSGKEHPEKDRAPHLKNRKFWQERPLTDAAKAYAAADVTLLVEAANILLLQFPTPIARDRARRLSNARVQATKSRTYKAKKFDAEEGDIDTLVSEIVGANCEADVTRTPCRLEQVNEIDAVLKALPERISKELQIALPTADTDLVDIVMDVKRPVVFIRNNGRPIRVRSCIVTEEDIHTVLIGCGELTDANRACVGDSLHRCSVIHEPFSNAKVGVTIRMARVVYGIADVLGDLLKARKSLLLVGPPGRGKTTLLRDIARLLSAEHPDFDRRVMVVDTNNEIAGEAIEPHHAIGNARRMKVGDRENQYRTMLEAVQNHTPEALVIDEIGTRMEVTEAVSIQQRGVQLIATTHGRTLLDIIQNPHLRNLIGGVNTVILSAMEREAEGAVSKTRLERRMRASFDVCIELLGLHKWRVHHNVNEATDVVLRGLGEVVECEIRELDPVSGTLTVYREPFPNELDDVDYMRLSSPLNQE